MKITDRYIALSRELAELGYPWVPRAGDWMLDLTDESIGMLTKHIEKPALVARVNAQIPYGEQITALLAARSCTETTASDGSLRWTDRNGATLHTTPPAGGGEDVDEERLAALVEDFRRFGP